VEGRQPECQGAGPGALSRRPGLAERQHRDRRDASMTVWLLKAWLLAGLALAGINQASTAQPAEDTVTRIRACLRYEGTARAACFDSPWRELTRQASLGHLPA